MKKAKEETVKNVVEIIAIVLPAGVTICAIILEKIYITEKIWAIIRLIFTLITMVCSLIILCVNELKEKKYRHALKQYRDLLDYYCDGKRFMLDEAQIDFLKDKLAYKITIKKKYEVLSLENLFYSFSICCDKHPESIRDSIEYYNNQSGIWSDMDLHVCIAIERNGETRTYNDIYFEKEKEESNHIFFKAYYQTVQDDQRIGFSVKINDIITITYSFIGKTQYWGSYINRKINFNKADTVVKLLNTDNVLYRALIIDMDGQASEVEGCKQKKEGDYLIIKLPQNLPMNRIKRSFFRIYWDANSIFKQDDLNSPFIGQGDPFSRGVD